MKKQTIVVCSSASHYEKLFPIQKELRKMGYKVVIPKTAYKMKKNKNFDVTFYKTWQNNSKDYKKKKEFMDAHFKQIIKGDLILVANFDKNGLKGYIGGNVLMEITVAYMLKKKIFILNPVDKNLSIKEEIYGVYPTFLEGNLSNLNN